MNLAPRGIETLRLTKWCCANRGINRAKAGGIRGNRWPCASTFSPENAPTFRRDLSIGFQSPNRFLKAA